MSLESHFVGKSGSVRELFDALAAEIKKCGSVKVLPEKTRIAFQVRMSFIAVQVRRDYLIRHFVFARRVEHPRFTRVETFSPRNHLHAFRLDSLRRLMIGLPGGCAKPMPSESRNICAAIGAGLREVPTNRR